MQVQQGGVQGLGSNGLLGLLSGSREPLTTQDDRAQLAGMNSLANALRELSNAQVLLQVFGWLFGLKPELQVTMGPETRSEADDVKRPCIPFSQHAQG